MNRMDFDVKFWLFKVIYYILCGPDVSLCTRVSYSEEGKNRKSTFSLTEIKATIVLC